ncbi:pyridoxamine 5'-phosphate oxidase family protein [Sporosarcina sp. A2]|uniref:pyridoxamine 5'-phosphate oxidase family protein n=1 Tax=Sporosarcina sp. A2 TaxID=3393449 RepID=UPI003D79AE47
MNAKEIAKKIMDSSHVGTMATVEANKPFSRYMTFYHEDFTLYTATSKKTEKVDELEKNPNTHILLGYNDEGYGDAYLEIAGTVTISDEVRLKKKIWNEHMKPWFDGPEDPNLVILKVSPDAIRVMNKKGESPETITF